MKYDIEVTRDGRWWMVKVPAIDGLTQARRVSEAEEMARSLIATVLDVPLSGVELGRVVVSVAGVRNLESTRSDLVALRSEADRLKAEASMLLKDTATELVGAGVPMRDVGALLGISHQRVDQLVRA